MLGIKCKQIAFKGEFRKLSDNDNALRDDIVEDAVFTILPEVGKSFYITAPGRDVDGSMRYVRTSPVVEILPSVEGDMSFAFLHGN